MKRLFKKDADRGMALVTTIILMAVLMGFGLATWRYYTSDITFSGNYRYSREALYLAEAGVQEAIKRLSMSTSDTTTVTSSFGSGSPSQITSCAHIGENLQTGSFPTPLNASWKTFIYPAGSTLPTPAAGETNTRSFQSSAGALAYSTSSKPILVTYRLEDSTHYKGTVDGEVVLYGQDFGYGSAAPATGTQPVYVITATGKAANEAEKTVRVETTRIKLNINIQGALGSGVNVKTTGTSFIDGTNHRKNIDLSYGSSYPSQCLTTSPDNLPGRIYNKQISLTDTTPAWTLDASSTSVLAVVTTSPATVTPSSDTEKRGLYSYGKSSTTPDPPGKSYQMGGLPSPFPTFKQFLEGYGTPEYTPMSDNEYQAFLASADVTQLSGSVGPKGFTYIQGDLQYSGSIKAPEGYVLMYVTGDMTIESNTLFKGVIFVDGNLKITGKPVFLGGIMAKGTVDVDELSAGNMTLLYSKGVIDELNNNLGLFKILDWREIKR